MACSGPSMASNLPSDLLAVSFDDSRGFVGANCLKDGEYHEETEKTATPIFKADEWFDGWTCARCGGLVEREVEG